MKVARTDFGNAFRMLIEGHGGIEAVVAQLPTGEGHASVKFIESVFKASTGRGRLTYQQYFMALGTLYHHEIIGAGLPVGIAAPATTEKSE